jgi:hypothetical protein
MAIIPEDSINGRVERKLEQFAERQKQLAGRDKDD